MVPILALWLPILGAAVIVFVASAVIHMFLTYHRTDYGKLPNEDRLLPALRAENVSPGEYRFPWATSPKELSSPAVMEKFKRGPVGLLTIVPSGPPVMAKPLTQWFVFCLAMSVFVAYLTGRTLAPGAAYLTVFRVAGTVAFLGYAGSQAIDSIWRGQPWRVTVKNYFDGLVYALLTAGVFGWLWPERSLGLLGLS
jgi:hypothetical protein